MGICLVFVAHIVENVLNVFVVFEFLEQLVDALALFGGNVLEVVGDTLELRTYYLEAVFFEVSLYVGVFLEGTVENDAFVAVLIFVVAEFVHTVVNQLKFEVVEAHAFLGFDLEHALVLEEECQRALCAERASVLVEVRAHVCHGAGIVVGGCLDKDGDAEGAVAFVGYFLVIA